MKTKQRNSKAGFSLVELMVVVAIIGILATIAVPNFQRFQAKAKQSSAKVELSGIYTAQKAFYTEYASYYWHLPAVGFLPEGFNTKNANQANVPNRYYNTSAGTAGGVWPTSLNNGTAPTASAVYSDFTYTGGYFSSNTTLCAAALPASAATTQTTFVAAATGCPKQLGQGPQDTWTINENKSLQNSTAGI